MLLPLVDLTRLRPAFSRFCSFNCLNCKSSFHLFNRVPFLRQLTRDIFQQFYTVRYLPCFPRPFVFSQRTFRHRVFVSRLCILSTILLSRLPRYFKFISLVCPCNWCIPFSSASIYPPTFRILISLCSLFPRLLHFSFIFAGNFYRLLRIRHGFKHLPTNFLKNM